MGEKDDGPRATRLLLIIAALLVVPGLILTAFAVWWLAGRAPPPVPLHSVRVVEESDAHRKYEAEIAETAERNFATLTDAGGAAHARERGDLASFASLVDTKMRARVALEVVEAFFAHESGPIAESGTDHLRRSLATDALLRRRRKGLGRVSETRVWEVGGASPWRETVTGHVTFDATFEGGAVAEILADVVYAGDGIWRLDALAVVPYPPGKRWSSRLAADWDISRESCRDCGAIRFRSTGEEWTTITDATEHAHTWTPGTPSGLVDPVPVGVVLLVSRPPFVVGVILRRVSIDSWGKCDYDWAYREDGGTSLDPSDPAVTTGHATASARIDVVGVRVGWSHASEGNAWVLYPCRAGERIGSQDPRLCLTPERGFDGVDAADPRWRFRASPSDPGERLDAQRK